MPRSVFVFGSNRAGRHGTGAALTAVQKFGAVHGVGEGLTGHAYALPTKDHRLEMLPLEAIRVNIERFLDCASYYRGKWFLLTMIGCGCAGYSTGDILRLFDDRARRLHNIYWPEQWARIIDVRRVSFDDHNNLVKVER